jgi:hypothetical protein
MVYEHYKLNEELGAVYDINDLMAVTLKGDSKLEHFLITWDATLAVIKIPPGRDVYEPLFLNQLRKSQALKEEIAHYDRSERGDANGHRSYEVLYRSCQKYLERLRHDANRRAHVKSLTEGGAHAPALAVREGRGKEKTEACRMFKEGKCKKGKDCKYSHRDGGKSQSRGRSNDRGQSKAIERGRYSGRKCDRESG